MTDAATPVMIASTIDCQDLESVTSFWASLLEVEYQIHEPFGFLAPSENRRVTIWLQRVPEGRDGKNRVHLDFVAGDLDAACERVVALGGSVGETHSWQDFRWKTCADPEGNLFDIMQAQQPAGEGPMRST